MSLSARIITIASNTLRSLGQSLNRTGQSIEVCKHTSDKLVPSTRFVAVDGIVPTVSPAIAFVAPNASVIGDVTLSKGVSVWYGATLRGDVHSITVGENSCIGDRAVVHVAKISGDYPSVIGKNVTVGPGAVVHAATLKDGCVVGPSAQVLDGAIVESNSVVSAGSVVTPGTIVKEGELWEGNPAKSVRKLSADEMANYAQINMETVELACMHAFETSKTMEQLLQDEEYIEDATTRDPEYYPYQPNGKAEEGDVLGQGSPGLIFDSVLTNPEEGLKFVQRREVEEKKKAEEEAA
jgi:carbonic anhydrase/acetyltransferase-like protein (isoleucine patch superfamily)